MVLGSHSRRRLGGRQAIAVLALSLASSFLITPAAFGHALSSDCVAHPGTSPDVIVGDIHNTTRWGTSGGITAYSIGTTSCNLGTCWLNWISSTNDHPAIGENMYRMRNGRFEHVGQSWLKHGFTALTGNVCATCQPPVSGSYLGVNCSDPYDATLNGSQGRLGPKSEVNPTTGDFPYPPTTGSVTGGTLFKRLQVHNTDLDPTLNSGASYFVEAQYVTWDDTNSGNSKNNYSYRAITVSGTSPTFNIALSGSTFRQQPAINAWVAADPTVGLTSFGVTGDGSFMLGSKVTQLSPTSWHYEYAVMNLNSYRAAGTFTVPIPSYATITNVGFHDVDYHSSTCSNSTSTLCTTNADCVSPGTCLGDPIPGTDWTSAVTPTSVSWSTQTFAQNANANALRWGTLYNFRFDANVPPMAGSVTVGLWRPGAPDSTTVSTQSPSLCNTNGICEPGENCTTCPADCFHQGGGVGCCGNSVCEAGENPCRCAADCGTPTATETSCGNGIDDDCDNATDCADVDCCHSAACSASDADHDGYSAICDCNNNDATVYPGAPQLCDGKNNDCSDPSWPAVPPAEADADGDTHRACAGDCDDANPAVWATPGEAQNLMLSYDAPSETTLLTWTAPSTPGGTVVHYDTLRSDDLPSFMIGTVCVETDGADTSSTDVGPPAPGLSSYLVRARNACPNGLGILGYDSNNQPEQGRTCP